MWERVVGQERAVAMLQRAAERPGHAYLLVGPRGSGVEQAARCFAAALLGVEDDDRARGLVLRGAHPDVVEFEPTHPKYLIDEFRLGVIPEVHRAPVEGDRKVVVLRAADCMREDGASALLKTIEEPPPRTVVMLLTERPDSLLPTIRSRCQRVDFGYVGVTVRSSAIEEVRAAFGGITARVDGTGVSALGLVGEISAALDDAVAATEAANAAELAELEEQVERSGYPPRTATAIRKRLTDRHKQVLRRARTDALTEGIAAIECVYRDALTLGDPPIRVDARAAARALDACREARAVFEFNPSEALLLERLVLHLPAVAAGVTG